MDNNYLKLEYELNADLSKKIFRHSYLNRIKVLVLIWMLFTVYKLFGDARPISNVSVWLQGFLMVAAPIWIVGRFLGWFGKMHEDGVNKAGGPQRVSVELNEDDMIIQYAGITTRKYYQDIRKVNKTNEVVYVKFASGERVPYMAMCFESPEHFNTFSDFLITKTNNVKEG